MDRSSRNAVAVIVVFAALWAAWVYSTSVANIAPHEEEYYIISYTKDHDIATGVAITQIRASDNVTGDDSVGLRYAGHYDFETGLFYKVYSEGKPGWLYRKITKFEILEP